MAIPVKPLILTAEEADAYRAFSAGIPERPGPPGVHEEALAASIVGNRWRVNQIAATESAIYAMAQHEYADRFTTETPAMASAMVRALIFEEKRQTLDRLERYESRLSRQVNKDMAQLTHLQTTRKALEAEQQKDAIALLTHFTTAGTPWNPADFGFVWSIAEIQLLEERQFLRTTVCKV